MGPILLDLKKLLETKGEGSEKMEISMTHFLEYCKTYPEEIT